jgi:predicted DCC family thiol-disulfide oxidoreductase YuxK
MANAADSTSRTNSSGDPQEGPVLLYDGECGICAASVQWVLRHERSTELRFAALQSTEGTALRRAAGIREDVDSLIWIDSRTNPQPKARIYSGAILATLKYVGGFWRVPYFALLVVPKPLRDLGYRVFARYRKLVRQNQCPLPTASQRARFLEV